jgi:catechol 2,3-dioxygenase-like lactoylglutathione lyase family enzyme
MKNLKTSLPLLALLPLVLIIVLSFNKPAPSDFERGIIEIGVVTEDFEKSYDFYINVLGMTRTGGFDVDKEFSKRSGLADGIPFKVAILKLKDSDQATQWKIMSFNRKPSHKYPKYINDDTGVQYVTVFVKSMKPFIERIKKHKVKFLGETPTKLDGERQFVLIQDPDGTFIELIGPE